MAGKRTTRARAINKPEEVAAGSEVAAAGDVLQQAIDKLGEAGDAIPSSTQMDSTNIRTEVNSVPPPNPFEEQYDAARTRGLAHLKRVRTATTGGSTLIPPNARVHPRLGRWGIQYNGKWLIIRWIGIRQQQRQRRFEQGYQYFEGRDQIAILGLDPDVYMNDRGRVQIGDSELGWVPEEYVFEHLKEAKERQEAMVATARDRVYNNESAAVPDVHVFEGSEGEVMDQLSRLRHGGKVSG